MRRMKQTLAAALCLTVLTSLASPRKAEAQFAVFDAVNWVENALQVIQQAYEIYQRYQQLYNDYQRYATMAKNLERFDELTFQNLVGLAAAVNDIIQYGESLGHTLNDIDAQFAETFPGYEPILGDDWLEIFEHRNRRTLDTLRYSLDALNRISWNSIPSQDILEGLAADAAAADGNVEALQAANELLHHQAGQLAKISQQNHPALPGVTDPLQRQERHAQVAATVVRQKLRHRHAEPLPQSLKLRTGGLQPTSIGRPIPKLTTSPS